MILLISFWLCAVLSEGPHPHSKGALLPGMVIMVEMADVEDNESDRKGWFTTTHWSVVLMAGRFSDPRASGKVGLAFQARTDGGTAARGCAPR